MRTTHHLFSLSCLYIPAPSEVLRRLAHPQCSSNRTTRRYLRLLVSWLSHGTTSIRRPHPRSRPSRTSSLSRLQYEEAQLRGRLALQAVRGGGCRDAPTRTVPT